MQATLLNRYKIGLVLIAAFAFIVMVVVFIQASATKQDDATTKAANDISITLDNYIDNKGVVPLSLKVAGVHGKIPSTISYQRLSSKDYKFCVTYRVSVGSFGLLNNMFGSGDDGDYTDNTELYIPNSHHAGANCQTIKPSDLGDYSNNSSSSTTNSTTTTTTPWVKNSDGTYTVCGVKTNYFVDNGHVTQGPPATPGSLTMDATSYPYAGARQLFLFSPTSQVFDQNCNALTPSDLHIGDTVDVFDITASPTTDAVSIFLKLSY